MSLKILIYGSKGWIGNMFVNNFKENYPNLKFMIIDIYDTIEIMKKETK